ncbi:hypothetical protein M422DRAFT_155986 [Sphaerobolus stellatus SS14]|nr:hypothetical protein M422DRAFT_155986 [Sphaerobolus stellatus SS14]
MTQFSAFLSFLLLATNIVAFPQYGSLAGLNERELEDIMPRLSVVKPQLPPGPLNDTSAKLVNDAAHPFQYPSDSDIRGACPGLNTLANHGYLPRSGIVTPTQIVNAVQEGFNMGNDLAVFLVYAVFIVDGNPLTGLFSLGGKTQLTGPNPPKPAVVGGLNTHALFEGDASTTRQDAFFGDNHSFNETQFDELVEFSNKFGGGVLDLTAASEFRFQRIQESIATNPTFSFVSPRYVGAYAETAFQLLFFVDGRKADARLPLDVARGFFQDGRMPDGFFRTNQSTGFDVVGNVIQEIFEAHPIQPGGNQGSVNTYTVDPNSAGFSNLCQVYTDFINNQIKTVYPNPKGALRDALNTYLGFFFSPLQGACTQVFPYGN